MNYQEFIEDITSALSLRVEKDTTLRVQTIKKNNGLSYEGLIMVRPEVNISPTIYLTPYYHRYLEGVSLEDIYDDIMATYHRYSPKENFDISRFTEYEKVKNCIVTRLVDARRNEALLEQVPHVSFLDFAVVFCALVSVDDKECGSILIHNSHLDYWNINQEVLYPLAIANTKRLLPYYFKDLGEALIDMGKEQLLLPYLKDCNMYLLSNEKKIYGASVVLYPGVLEELSDQLECDFLMIPSSVHEWILLGFEEGSYQSLDATYYSYMVQEVNELELADDEVLSDHVYYYERAKKEFRSL